MKKLILLPALLFALGACGGEKDHDDHDGHSEEEHGHAAKHGGDLIPLGEHEGFLEVKLDHDAGKLSVWVYLGEEMNAASLDRAPVLNLKTAAGPKQLTGEGSGGTWSFSDAALKSEPESAAFRIKMGGKTYSAAWEHHDDEDHEDHEGHDHD